MLNSLDIKFPIAICGSVKSKVYHSYDNISALEFIGMGWKESDNKENVELFSPIIPNNGGEYGIERNDKNIAYVSSLVLDFDDGVQSIDEIKRRLDPNGFIGHTTWSHSIAHPKFRIIVPIDSPIRADLWKGFWKAFVEERGLSIDKKCCNPSRIYYFPSRKPGISREEWGEVINDGIAIDSQIYLEIAAKTKPDAKVINRISSAIKKPASTVDWNTFDIPLFLDSMGWRYTERDGKYWTYCPWRYNHSNPMKDGISDAFFGFMPNGRIMYHCSHAHCADKWIGSIINEFDGERFCEQPGER